MLELAHELLPLLQAGTAVAAVTVTSVARSAPRGAGATMAVTRDGRVIGSISGGCIEGDAIALAYTALARDSAAHGRFGFDDDTAYAAGLACGGSVEVVAYPVRADDAVTRAALAAVTEDRATTIAIVLTGASAGRILEAAALRQLIDDHDGTLSHAIAWRETIRVRASDGAEMLVMSSAPRPRLIILGAGEHAAALCRVGSAAGFAVTVCDAWETLVTADRFPSAELLVARSPQEYLQSLDEDSLDARTAVCVLTHDERLDVPALQMALTLPVGFVGAMGARSTVARRAHLLREAGVSEVDLTRVHAPLGLDLGGSTPDETAISMLAEIIASRHGGSGAPLRERTGPVHRPSDGRIGPPAVSSCIPGIPAPIPTPSGARS